MTTIEQFQKTLDEFGNLPKKMDRIKNAFDQFASLELEEKELLLRLMDSLSAGLEKHSDKYHTKIKHVHFAGDLIDPPDVDEIITGTEYPFHEWAFDYKEIDKAFCALCDNMEQQYFEV
jgi:hypothetical protein